MATTRQISDSKGRKYTIHVDGNNEYIVISAGNTLWWIADAYYGNANKYTEIAKLNNLRDPNYIVVGQTIYLKKSSGGTSSSTASTVNMATVTQFGLLCKEDDETSRELYATWSWPKSGDTDHYEVEWRYKLAIWIYVDSTTTRPYSTYTPPTNSMIKEVQFRVRPIPKEVENSNGTKTKKFSADWSAWKSHSITNKPATPSSAPAVKLEGLKLTVSMENVDASLVEFELIKDDSEATKKSQKWAVNTGSVSGTFTVVAGSRYKVRCRLYKDGIYGEWSPYSSNYKTMPSAVTLKDPEAKTGSDIYVEWSSAGTATDYTLECTDNEKGFVDAANIIHTATITTDQSTGTLKTNYTVPNLATETKYSFRVKAIDNDASPAQESAWSEVKTGIIANGPIAPTTWASTTTAQIGEEEVVKLYWKHNSEDGSIETYAEVKMVVEGVSVDRIVSDVTAEIGTLVTTQIGSVTYPIINAAENSVIFRINNSTKDSEKTKTHSLIVPTKNFENGAKVTWCACTAGASGTPGEWSAERIVEIYNTPTVYLVVTDSNNDDVDTLGSLPFTVTVTIDDVNQDIQYPISYQLLVLATEQYSTSDNLGNPKTVNVGDAVYSEHFNQPAGSWDPLEVQISASDISLENGQTYIVKCITAMSSGITVETDVEIDIAWLGTTYQLNAEVGINTDNYSANIRPYCESSSVSYREVVKSGALYILSSSEIDYIFGEQDIIGTTITGESVYQGTIVDGTKKYYALVETHEPIEDVLISVYRREYDGSFTEIESNIDGALNSFVTDPHPALDYARYRLVAKDKNTGIVSYYDMPNIPIGEKSIIIQWDEPQSAFYTADEPVEEGIDRSQSILRFPYNIDVQNKRQPQVSFVNYIGRKHPVSYYGTQLGETATWSTEIPKYDQDTIYAMHRLSGWMGDVYVREPYGTGYWANITIDFGQKHKELTIPISINVTRVEGGK